MAAAPDGRPAITRNRPPLALVRVANPVVRRLLGSRLHRPLSGAVLVLHLRGRRSGRTYDIPVGYAREQDGALRVLSDSPWRVNLRGGADVEVTLQGRRPMRATIEEDPGRVADVYERILREMGWKAGQRRLGLRISVKRMPTRDELVDVVRRTGLSVITLAPR